MKKILETLKTNKTITNCCIILTFFALAAGCTYGITYWNDANKPELTAYVDIDPGSTVTIDEDEVPLGNTKVTTKKNTKTTKKTVKLKKAAKKTRTVKKPVKTKTTKKTTKKSRQVVTVQTTTATAVTEKYKKNDKKKVVTTKVTTTVQTTTTDAGGAVRVSATQGSTGPYNVDIQTAAPKADQRVINAYKTLGFSLTINSGVSYSGYFNARNQQIILRNQDDTVYHELGHFLAFLAGNADRSSAFVSAFNAEKGKYTGVSKEYVTQNSSEYYAESFKDYVMDANGLRNSRPETYKIIEESLNKLTDSYVGRIKSIYASIWK